MIRTPAVAGTFYPDNASELRGSLETLTFKNREPTDAIGIIVPHAGYVYSGPIAGEVFSSVRLPERPILLGPNHTGMGVGLSIMARGAWQTPIGELRIDSALARRLMATDPELEDDAEAHRMEHCLEVELPFIRFLTGPDACFVPIVVGTSRLDALMRLGEAIATVVGEMGVPILIVASTDMNHYESDTVTRAKDRKAIDRMLERDPEGLYRTVIDEDISMCGFAATVAVLAAVNRLGAKKAKLVRYGTSGDTFGERERVVGYAGITIE